ncbi:MAG: hypothetical protein HC871_03720 [Rhizobiales bacterium]|nr:hypothetical protein [Hyphomicrobiales bacterium]
MVLRSRFAIATAAPATCALVPDGENALDAGDTKLGDIDGQAPEMPLVPSHPAAQRTGNFRRCDEAVAEADDIGGEPPAPAHVRMSFGSDRGDVDGLDTFLAEGSDGHMRPEHQHPCPSQPKQRAGTPDHAAGILRDGFRDHRHPGQALLSTTFVGER